MKPEPMHISSHDYQPAPDCLAGQVILVTGAASGIGRAVALACARHGAETVLLDINQKGLESLYDEIEAASLPPATIVPLDLAAADQAAFDELASQLQSGFGRVNAIVHCAADVGALCPLENFDAGNWYRVMQTNLNSAYLLSRACLKLLRESGHGSIVFTTADVARHGKAYWGAYAIAGHAIEGMAEVFSAELSGEQPVLVNTIDPGTVATRLRGSLYPGEDASTLRQPNEVAPSYIYMLDKVVKDGLSGRQFTADQAG